MSSLVSMLRCNQHFLAGLNSIQRGKSFVSFEHEHDDKHENEHLVAASPCCVLLRRPLFLVLPSEIDGLKRCNVPYQIIGG